MQDKDKIISLLNKLQEEHRELDDKILRRQGVVCSLEVQRLKRHKLALRDEISKLKSMLVPDIIA